MKRVLIGLLVIVVSAVAYVYFAAWRSPPVYVLETAPVDYPLLSWDDYQSEAQSVSPPIIQETSVNDGAVLIFGATHSSDPEHPQFSALEEAYESFAPDVVLVEGRMGFFLPPFMKPINMYGESGALAANAKRDDLELYTWELCRACEPELLLKRFSEQQVALYLLMRPYYGSEETPIEAARERMSSIIADRGKRPGISGVIQSQEDFEAAWKAEFPEGPVWQTMRSVYGGPGFLSEMFEYGNDIRDQHMLNIIRELTNEGHRVMVTAGWSHALRIKPALDELSKNNS